MANVLGSEITNAQKNSWAIGIIVVVVGLVVPAPVYFICKKVRARAFPKRTVRLTNNTPVCAVAGIRCTVWNPSYERLRYIFRKKPECEIRFPVNLMPGKRWSDVIPCSDYDLTMGYEVNEKNWTALHEYVLENRKEDITGFLTTENFLVNWEPIVGTVTRTASICSGSSRLFSSKWLVGFTHRHRKRIALRVVDYGLSGGLQSKQKTHPGRMDTFEHILRTLYTDLHLPVSHENLLEVQDMWVHHVESPKTRKVFALKGRKNVRLTIGIASGGGGRKKRVRHPKLPDSAMLMGAGQPVPVIYAPQVNETAVRVALHAIMRGGYTEEDAKKILRDINVPIL